MTSVDFDRVSQGQSVSVSDDTIKKEEYCETGYNHFGDQDCLMTH